VKRRTERARAIAATALIAFALSACTNDELARRDRLTPWSGDANARNAAIQTINPWPRAAFSSQGPTLGSKAEEAMQVYRAPQTKSVAASTTRYSAPKVASSGASSAN